MSHGCQVLTGQQLPLLKCTNVYLTEIPMTYHPWFPVEPNNANNREDVLALEYRNGKWGFNDAYTAIKCFAVCEYTLDGTWHTEMLVG